jgi:hypothetical protein
MTTLMEQWWRFVGAPADTWLRVSQCTVHCAQRIARMHADAVTANTLKQAQDVDHLLSESDNGQHTTQAWQRFWAARAAEAAEYNRSMLHTVLNTQVELATLLRDQFGVPPAAAAYGSEERDEGLEVEMKPVPRKAARAERPERAERAA